MALIEMSSVEESILALIVSDDGVLFVLTSCSCLFIPGCSQLPDKFQFSPTSVFYKVYHIIMTLLRIELCNVLLKCFCG